MNNVRRKDRLISQEVAQELLLNSEYGVLSSVSKNGEPYGFPLNYCVIDNALYFHCATAGKKLVNFNFENRVSFCVIGTTEVLPSEFGTKYMSTIVSGKVIEVLNEDKQKGLEGLLQKYSPNHIESGLDYIKTFWKQTRVYKIDIEHISGKGRFE